MSKKRNVVLYLDAELVSKARDLGFNRYKTFENQLKLLINQFPTFILKITVESVVLVARDKFKFPFKFPAKSKI